MARPREFDETAVLDAAMACFWAHGYETTSVRDLARSMQITSASLYNAFGDKLALYRRALDHYLHISVQERIRRLETGLAPLVAVQTFLDEVIERSVSDPLHRGCMLVNAALEMAPRDAGVREVVARELSAIEAFFRRCVEAGQADGSIDPAQPATATATTLLSVLVGIRVLARVRPERALLESAARTALVALKPNQTLYC
ncbi:MAG: TetR/AcrR family transcriptional regulator [Alphaproteobacteria bacterium]|nr:MAG: TetR/AcrR family transcriptional regulator [Alphaproteobacteria bacterium]